MKIRPEDKVEEIEYISISLRAVGMNVDYPTAELIKFTLDKVEELGGKMSIKDSCKLKADHDRYWGEYFENQEKTK